MSTEYSLHRYLKQYLSRNRGFLRQQQTPSQYPSTTACNGKGTLRWCLLLPQKNLIAAKMLLPWHCDHGSCVCLLCSIVPGLHTPSRHPSCSCRGTLCMHYCSWRGCRGLLGWKLLSMAGGSTSASVAAPDSYRTNLDPGSVTWAFEPAALALLPCACRPKDSANALDSLILSSPHQQ